MTRAATKSINDRVKSEVLDSFDEELEIEFDDGQISEAFNDACHKL